jgi:hypothetical protein
LILGRGKDANTLPVYLEDSLARVKVKRADRAKQIDVDFGPTTACSG